MQWEIKKGKEAYNTRKVVTTNGFVVFRNSRNLCKQPFHVQTLIKAYIHLFFFFISWMNMKESVKDEWTS